MRVSMTPDHEWRGDRRHTEQPPRATGGGPQAQRAPVRIGSTLDSLHKISKASHYETDTDRRRPYRSSTPRLKSAKLRPPEFLCRPHLCRIRRARFIADAVRANSR